MNSLMSIDWSMVLSAGDSGPALMLEVRVALSGLISFMMPWVDCLHSIHIKIPTLIKNQAI